MDAAGLRGAASAGTLTGLGTCTRLFARLGRWFYLTWVLALAAVVPVTALAYETIVDPASAGLLIATFENNPTIRALLGPPTDLWTAGGFTVWRVGTFVAALTGIMAVLGVVRSTRGEEEHGRTEALRARAVGRHAPLAAGVLLALLACALLAVLVALGMVAVGEPVPGSVAFGLGVGLVGAVFVGVGAVAAQLTPSATTARSLGLWTLGTAYIVRAVADGSPTDSLLRQVAWASPVQWMALARPYADERWWVLLLPLVLAAALLAAAVVLESRRDHGAGLWGTGHRQTRASGRFGPTLGLVWRLQRGSVIGWTFGLVLFAVALGSLSSGFDDMVRDNPQLLLIFERLGGGSQQLVEAYFAALLAIVSIVMAVLGVVLFHRLAVEEAHGRVELVLSRATPRTRLLGAYLLLAVGVPVLLFALVGAGLAVNQAVTEGDWAWPARIAGAALALSPGGLAVLGLAVLLHGLAPRLTWLVWAVIGWSLFLVWVGAVLGLPEWASRLTPWAALPELPTEDMSWPPVLATTAVAAVLMLVGIVGYRRRDVGTG